MTQEELIGRVAIGVGALLGVFAIASVFNCPSFVISLGYLVGFAACQACHAVSQ